MYRLTFLALSLAACSGCHDAGEPGNLVPKTVADDDTLPRIELAGALFHAEAFGDPAAPLVIVLHGGPGSDYRAMLPLAALADDGYRVVFWDQRGAGLSERHDPGTLTQAEYMEDLRLLIEHYTVADDQPIVFIGQSWGAMYATGFINDHGDYAGRVRGAILSEPGALNTPQLDAYIKELNAQMPLTSEQFNDGIWSRQFVSAADHERADYLLGMLSYGGRPSDGNDPDNPAPFWRLGASVNDRMLELVDREGFDFTTNLDAFPTNVLFLRGERNTVMTLEHQEVLAAEFPSAGIITIPGCGHEMIWEKPAEYLEHVRAYFQSIEFNGVTP